jgi:hypothetical protein
MRFFYTSSSWSKLDFISQKNEGNGSTNADGAESLIIVHDPMH